MDTLKKLREPFPPNQISYLPKGGVKLAYVGHAALTDRLLDTDPAWTWEPLALDARGLPAIDEAGGMWIKLTVCGVTRLGYGDAGQKKGGDAMKERIGDALRNAAMRFGAALDLWHKGDLHADDTEDQPTPEAVDMSPAAIAKRITAGVAKGDAAGAAQYLATAQDVPFDDVWALLDAITQDKLTAKWPNAEAA
jgi:hypothetical protein